MSTQNRTLFVVGATHHRTPLELREKLALTPDKLSQFWAALAKLRGLSEFAVLNTCNRIEFYGVSEDASTIAELQERFCEFQGFSADEFERVRQQSVGQEAVRHLLEVSSGIDSQMIGETEILGQVKDAYAEAQTRQSVGPILNRLFQKSFQHAKYVRTNTAITEGQISVANVAVDLAQKIFGQLEKTKILLLGAGEIGEKTAKAFQSRGAAGLTVSSRTLERAMGLAREFGAAALPFEHVANRLSDYDVVVCSTSAPHAVITAGDVSAAMKKRRAQPLFFIDLALPRDVDPAVANLENVFIYNLDDLARIAEENRAARENEVRRAREILKEKSEALWKQIGGLVAGSAVAPRAAAAQENPLSFGLSPNAKS
ncbi:MAG TPA: glutamyl-tRNA reductase [Opitutaceae bacterium]|nr:glutamyl-tRNA reductase [Opitutaceae bacterium]